jgi:hypothetical protein
MATAPNATVCTPARFVVLLCLIVPPTPGAQRFLLRVTIQGLLDDYRTGPDGRPCHVTPPSPFSQSLPSSSLYCSTRATG